ncbi:MAG TPA: VWA domain-containing protein [Vicinamibacterales bacterium]|nr:VWA domain-containing protein [Vicinamibacterales bacterium]
MRSLTRGRIASAAHYLFAIGVVCAICGSVRVLFAQSPTSSTAVQAPAGRAQFEARAELVLVDVSVTTNDSRPVTDLSAADFDLEVNGQPRPIVAIQYISTLTEAPDTPPAADAPSSNDAPTSGRLMLFVVDDGHIRVGSAQAVVRTSEMLLEQLAPGDLVGVARLPTGVGSVEFTTDRQRVLNALRRPAGTASATLVSQQVQISEAFALETGDTDTWARAVSRECAGLTDMSLATCADALEVEARTATTEASARAMQTLRYLDQLFIRLARLNTPVNVIMLSEGLYLGRAPASMVDVSRRAAEARVTLHVVRPTQSMMGDASRASAPSMSFSFDDYLMRDGLEQLASQTRGRLLQVSAGTGAGVFERLNRELSGYYLVGFEPTAADRTGRQRRIKVQVRRRGLDVRARPTFALSRETAATTAINAGRAREPEAVIKDLLASPLPDRGIPMRVTTYNVAEERGDRVRVLVAAEIGEPSREPTEWQTGILVTDKDDKPKAGKVARMILSPATPRQASPRLLQTTLLLEPGEYTLRLAVADGEGRTGSVHHTIHAGLIRTAGRQEVSDLLIAAEPTPPDPARFMPIPLVDTDMASFQLSVVGQSNGQLANTAVTVQVAESLTGPALTSIELPLALREGSLRTFGGMVRLGLLPPGEYVARAVITAPGQSETRVLRSFRYAPSLLPPEPRDPTVALPLSVDEEVLPPPPPRIAVRLPRFNPSTVLEPEIVDAFLGSLEAIYPPSPDAQAVLTKAREGRFEAPEPKDSMPAADEATFAFVRGLSELQKQRYAQATAWFQVALKAASDFLGAAFYIGACHAASGRDQDAVGAWQLSLLSDAADVVYPPLVDGLLRLGDGLQALTFIDEAPDAWKDDDTRDERQATAEAMTGAYVPALEKLHGLIDRRPDDLDLVYLALQVMYRVRQETGAINEADRERFVTYATRYTAAKGSQAALVGTWLKYVVKP